MLWYLITFWYGANLAPWGNWDDGLWAALDHVLNAGGLLRMPLYITEAGSVCDPVCDPYQDQARRSFDPRYSLHLEVSPAVRGALEALDW